MPRISPEYPVFRHHWFKHFHWR